MFRKGWIIFASAALFASAGMAGESVSLLNRLAGDTGAQAVLVPVVQGRALPASKPSLIHRVTPFQKWSAKGPKTVGLLVQKEIAGVCRIDHGQNIHQVRPEGHGPCVQGDDNTYSFERGGDSPVAVYFKSKGEGYNFLRNWRMSNGFTSDAAQFSRTTPNPWGLKDEAHRATVEVNGGTGSPANELHFIVTDATVSNAKPAEALRSFLSPFSLAESPESRDADARLERAIRASEGRSADFPEARTNPHHATTYAGFSATLQGGSVLLVSYYRRAEDVYVKQGTLVSRPSRRCPPGSPCMPPPPPRRNNTYFTYGAEYAVEARYNIAGVPISRRTLPVTTYYSKETRFEPGRGR